MKHKKFKIEIKKVLEWTTKVKFLFKVKKK